MKKIIFYVFLVCAVVILVRANYTRKLTDDEMIEIAIERTMQRILTRPPVIKTDEMHVYKYPAYVVPYKSIEHFLEENPKCCIIYDKYNGKVMVVSVSATVFYLDRSGRIHKGNAYYYDVEYFKK